MFRIRRFNVLKTSTVIGATYMIIIGVIIIPIFLLLAIVGIGSNAPGGALAAIAVGIALTLFYGLIGWIGTVVLCLGYNLAARWFGGIEVQVESVGPPPPPPAWMPSTTPPPSAQPPAGQSPTS